MYISSPEFCILNEGDTVEFQHPSDPYGKISKGIVFRKDIDQKVIVIEEHIDFNRYRNTAFSFYEINPNLNINSPIKSFRAKKDRSSEK